MTITYQYRVANARLGTFVKLLGMWRGSVYKLMYKEMLIFCALYTAISLTYRIALNEQQRGMFEDLAVYCGHYTTLIPVSFVLGFYVSVIVTRWWTQFMNVPWPDRTLFMACCYLHGNGERARIMRRSIARYMMFGHILISRSISVAVMKRFPTLEHIVESGLVTKEEVAMYEKVECKYNKFWVPLLWANGVLARARREGLIQTDWGLRMIIEPLADFRDKCSRCFVYDWITIPLVYTQVVTLAVYTFFGACLIGRQFLDPSKDYPGYEYDLYVPLFTLLQFFFYMGWLKVAEQLINPFGEDDDDFDINWLLDRHIAVAMTLVDHMCGTHPDLIKDPHFDEAMTELPYTAASFNSRRPNFQGSTFHLEVPNIHEQRIIPQDEAENMTSRRRTTSFNSNFAGSVLSLITGRSSSTVRPHQQQSNEHLHRNYTDHLHVPKGHTGFQNTGPEHERLLSDRDPNKTLSSWSSDSDIQDILLSNLGRERAHTDADQQDSKKTKKDRHRKRSFPLSLLRRLTSDHRKSSQFHGSPSSRTTGSGSTSGSQKNKENEDIDNTPEYVPLKRASLEPEVKEKDNQNNERKRKISFPLAMIIDKKEGSGSGSTHSVPGSVESTSAKSRFTVEHVPDSGIDENSKYKRNAQKIENSFSGKSVSRAPMLTAIEEGNTVTSITQILPSDDESSDDGLQDDRIAEEPEKAASHSQNTMDVNIPGHVVPTIVIDSCSNPTLPE